MMWVTRSAYGELLLWWRGTLILKRWPRGRAVVFDPYGPPWDLPGDERSGERNLGERRPVSNEPTPITEDWLSDNGFRWHQFDRQPGKHWVLWLGPAIDDGMTSSEDLGIELAEVGRDDEWFCWLRGDLAGRYSRFIHVRHLKATCELIRLVEGLTGCAWNPENNRYGSMHSPRRAAKIREDDERLDRRMLLANPKWTEVEKDDTRGRALPGHLDRAEEKREG